MSLLNPTPATAATAGPEQEHGGLSTTRHRPLTIWRRIAATIAFFGPAAFVVWLVSMLASTPGEWVGLALTIVLLPAIPVLIVLALLAIGVWRGSELADAFAWIGGIFGLLFLVAATLQSGADAEGVEALLGLALALAVMVGALWKDWRVRIRVNSAT